MPCRTFGYQNQVDARLGAHFTYILLQVSTDEGKVSSAGVNHRIFGLTSRFTLTERFGQWDSLPSEYGDMRPLHVPGAKIETINPSKRLVSDCRGDSRDTIPIIAVVPRF